MFSHNVLSYVVEFSIVLSFLRFICTLNKAYKNFKDEILKICLDSGDKINCLANKIECMQDNMDKSFFHSEKRINTLIDLNTTMARFPRIKLDFLSLKKEVPDLKYNDVLATEEPSQQLPSGRIDPSYQTFSSHITKVVTSPCVLKETKAQEVEKCPAANERLYEIKDWLEETFPQAFNFKHPVPLKRGVRKDLMVIECPFSKRELCQGLNAYIHNPRYLKAIIEGEWRYDLKGQPFEKIFKENKDYAIELLNKKL